MRRAVITAAACSSGIPAARRFMTIWKVSRGAAAMALIGRV
jgi:hypothetical protein